MVTEKDHEYCLRCGRKLKNPSAREKGYGAICERKMKVNNSKLFKIIGPDEKAKDGHLQSSAKEKDLHYSKSL